MRVAGVVSVLLLPLLATSCLATWTAHGAILHERRRALVELVGCQRAPAADAVRLTLLFRIEDGSYWRVDGTPGRDPSSRVLRGRRGWAGELHGAPQCALLRVDPDHTLTIAAPDGSIEQYRVPGPAYVPIRARVAFYLALPVLLAVDLATAPLQSIYVIAKLPDAR